MRWFVVVALAACHPARPIAPANRPAPVIVEQEVVIDPNSEALRDKRSYWKRVARAYMSQVPGPICICEQKPMFTSQGPNGPVTSYMTECSTYR